MIASEGGALQSAPGETTGGTGFHNSVSSGLGCGAVVVGDCANTLTAVRERINRKKVAIWIRMVLKRINQNMLDP